MQRQFLLFQIDHANIANHTRSLSSSMMYHTRSTKLEKIELCQKDQVEDEFQIGDSIGLCVYTSPECVNKIFKGLLTMITSVFRKDFAYTQILFY